LAVTRERLAAPIARPLMLHMGWVFILGGILFLALAGGLFLYGMYRSMVQSQPVDWQGFALIITAMGGAAATIAGIIIPLLRDRRMQRIEEIRASGQSASPFPDSPPPPPDDTLGPRPQENWQ
jgi:hypothetical protein